MIVPQAEFARISVVSRACVSKWISTGKISGEALVKQDGKTMIRVPVAQRQLGVRRDVGQALSNGLKTKLRSPAATETKGVAAKPDLSDEINEEIKRQKLEGIRRQNRREAEEELARQGRYVDAASARREMITIAQDLVRVFEGSLPEFATALAGEFKIEQRDVLHTLRNLFRKVRTKAAEKARKAAEQTPALVSDGVAEVDGDV